MEMYSALMLLLQIHIEFIDQKFHVTLIS